MFRILPDTWKLVRFLLMICFSFRYRNLLLLKSNNLFQLAGNKIYTLEQGEKKKKKKVTIRLSDEELSQGLEYLFKKSTHEILHFENMKEVQKVGVMKDETLFCSSRIMEGQELRAVGCLSETLEY